MIETPLSAAAAETGPPITGLIGSAAAMEEVYQLTRQVARSNASVLLLGETGTGKELIAKAIHHLSPRASGPFIRVNCGALHENLLESELFGHVRGAFTGAVADKPGRFELADGGTLFLDEVTEMPLHCQTKLLRALEERKIRRVGGTRYVGVDVRLVAATNRVPEQAVAEGALREDLFYRLDHLRIAVPPLRRRGSDVVELARHFLDQAGHSAKRHIEGFEEGVLSVFRAYDWPGNVRELKNVVERMVILGEGPVLGTQTIPEEIRNAAECNSEDASGAAPRDAFPSLKEVERRHIMDALAHAEGNKTQAARMLGIDRSTLYARLRQYGIETGH